MGIKRGAYSRERRTAVAAPAAINANVPVANVGAGLSAMAGAMREKARATREKWNVEPVFNALQRCFMIYGNVKDAQRERMINSVAKVKEYEHSVNAGLEEFKPDKYLELKRRAESMKATYESFGLSFIAAGPDDSRAAAKDFIDNRASREVRESFSRRFRIEEDAKNAAEMALVRHESDFEGVED